MAAAPAAVASLAHRADIQGLRAVAVLLVVLAHAGVRALPGGFVGVDVFFVLSGFLITGLLLAEARKRSSVSLVEFYVRRARRILPAAALTLLVTDVVTYFLVNFVRARDAVEDSVHAAGFAANFQFARRGVDYFARGDPPSPVLHYWSLSVEEQFYLVWPLVLSLALFGIAFVRRGRAAMGRERRLLWLIAVLTALSFLWSLHLTAAEPTSAYFSPFTRAWELGLGATLAVGASALARLPAAARLALGWGGIAAIGVAAAVFSERTPFPGSAALLPTLGTAAAIVAGMGERRPRLAVARLLSLRPMLVVGDRSYAFYLWHWPVLILAADYAGRDLSVAAKLGLAVVAFLLSCLSYALVENPIRRRVRSRTTTGVVAFVSMAAVLGTATVALAGIDRQQERFEGPVASASTARTGLRGPTSTARGALPTVIAAVGAAHRGAPLPAKLTPPISRLRGLGKAYAPPPECIAHDRSSVIASKLCRLGDRSSKKLVVLIGDSHAYMWLPALLETAWHDHLAVIPLLRLGCTPGKWFTTLGPDGEVCRAWLRWGFDQIRRLRPAVTLVGGSIDERQTSASRAATDGVVRAAQVLRGSGRVVVIGDPEGLDFEPVDCLLSRTASMATCTTTWPAGALAAYDEVDRRVTALGAGFLGTRGFVCYRRQCPAVIGRTIAWADNNHLTSAYSAGVSGAFRSAFLRASAAAARR